MENKNENGFYIHPLFTEVESNFRFFLLSIGMLTQKDLQTVTIQTWPKLLIDTTIPFDEFDGLIFDSQLTIDQFNQKFNVQNNGTKTDVNLSAMLQVQARLMCVFMYEAIHSSSYKGRISRELENFLYHIRNAAAHNNIIERKKRNDEVAKWREKIIDDTTENKEAFNSFINAADVILLIIDLSKELQQIDKNN